MMKKAAPSLKSVSFAPSFCSPVSNSSLLSIFIFQRFGSIFGIMSFSFVLAKKDRNSFAKPFLEKRGLEKSLI